MSPDPDELAELDAAATPEHPAEPAEQVRKAWKIENDEQAAWALRLILEETPKVTEREAAAAERRAPLLEALDRVDSWVERTTAESRRTIEFALAVLERYALDERERTDGDRKTIDTPDGKVETRAGRESIDVTDADDLLRFVRATKQKITEWAKPEYSVKKKEVKELTREAEAVQADVLAGLTLSEKWTATNPDGTPILVAVEDPARKGVLVFCPGVVAAPDELPPYPDEDGDGEPVVARSLMADLVDATTGETLDPDAGTALPVGTLVVPDPDEDPAEDPADQTWLVVPGVRLTRGAVTATVKPAVPPSS